MGVIEYIKENLSDCRDYIIGGCIKSFIDIESKLKKMFYRKKQDVSDNPENPTLTLYD